MPSNAPSDGSSLTALDRGRAQVLALVAEHYNILDEERRSRFVRNPPQTTEEGERWSGSWVSTSRGLDGLTSDRTITLVVLFEPGSCVRHDEYALTPEGTFIGRVLDPQHLANLEQALRVSLERQALTETLDDPATPNASPSRPRDRSRL